MNTKQNGRTIDLTPLFLAWVLVFGAGKLLGGWDISWWFVAGPWLIIPILTSAIFVAFILALPAVFAGKATISIGNKKYRRMNGRWETTS